MELPGYSLSTSLMANGMENVDTTGERVQRSVIAKYYQEYPEATGIASNMVNHVRVTSVVSMKEACEQGLCACGMLSVLKHIPFLSRLLHAGCGDCLKYRWLVKLERQDKEKDKVEQFCVRTNNVVLATGMFDVPRKLEFPGEDFPFVVHSVRALDALERKITTDSISSQPELDLEAPWVVVVGSGLSAADAVLFLRAQGRNVIHIYYSNKGVLPFSLHSFPSNSVFSYLILSSSFFSFFFFFFFLFSSFFFFFLLFLFSRNLTSLSLFPKLVP